MTIKTYLGILVSLMISLSAQAQQLTSAQQQILDQFELTLTDHRGVEFRVANGVNISHPNVKSALETFFATQAKKDYTILHIEGPEQSYFNQSLEIIEMVDLYLEQITIQNAAYEN